MLTLFPLLRSQNQAIAYLRMVPTNMKVFCTTHGYMGKEDLNMGYWNLKRNLGVTMHFSELMKKNGNLYSFHKFPLDCYLHAPKIK